MSRKNDIRSILNDPSLSTSEKDSMIRSLWNGSGDGNDEGGDNNPNSNNIPSGGDEKGENDGRMKGDPAGPQPKDDGSSKGDSKGKPAGPSSPDKSGGSENSDKSSSDAADAAEQAAQQAEKNGDSSQSDIARQAAEEAKQASSEANRATTPQQKQNAANKAQNAANKAQNAANESQSTDADSAQDAAQNAANAAQNAANAAQNAANASKQGNQQQMNDAANLAEQAAQQARDAAQKAREAANNAAKQGDTQAAQQAEQAANAAEQAANAADDAAQSAREGDTQSAQDSANQSKQSAAQSSQSRQSSSGSQQQSSTQSQSRPETQQEAANRAQQAADAAQDAADAAQDAANQAAQSGDPNVANEAIDTAKEAQQAADAAQDAADMAKRASTPQQASQAANQAQNAANKAQNAANKAQQAANEGQNNDPNSDGESASENAQNAAQNAENAAKNAQNATKSGNSQTTQEAAKAAQDAAKAAQDAAKAAQKAADLSENNGDEDIAEQARESAKQAEQAAQQAQQAANQAQQAANNNRNNQNNTRQQQTSTRQNTNPSPNNTEEQPTPQQTPQNPSDTAQQAADAAQQAANQAKEATVQAQHAAKEAQKSGTDSQANRAKHAAEQARHAAKEAQKAADEAQKAADDSKNAADPKEAQEAATDTQNSANKAQNNSTQSQQAANKAQHTANKAQDEDDSNYVDNAIRNAENAAQNAEKAKENARKAQENAKRAMQNVANNTNSDDQRAMDKAVKAAEDAADEAEKAAEAARDAAEEAKNAADIAKNAADKAREDGDDEAADKAEQAANAAEQAANESEKQAQQSERESRQTKQQANKARQDQRQAKQNGKPNAQQPKPDPLQDYMDGFTVGASYAYQIYLNGGFVPFTDYEIPGNLEIIKVLKGNVNEGYDSISQIIDDHNLDVEKKIDAIEDLMNGGKPPVDLEDIKKMGDEPLTVNAKGGVKKGKGGWFGSENIIPKEVGDKIREKRQRSNRVTDQEYLMGDDAEGVVQALGPILGGMINKANQLNIDSGPIEQIQGNIVASRVGGGNWRRWLKEFCKRQDPTEFERKGSIMMARMEFSDIKQRHASIVPEGHLHNVVLYIDTTGSTFGFVSLLINEIKKIAKDCHFDGMYVNSFTTKVKEHGKAKRSEILSKKFAIKNPNSGATDITAIYDHIVEHYTKGGGNLRSDIDAIIIITDTDGLLHTYHGESVASYSNVISASTFKKMFYLVFNDTEPDRLTAEKKCVDFIDKHSTAKCADFASLYELDEKNKTINNASDDSEQNESKRIMKLSERIRLYEARMKRSDIGNGTQSSTIDITNAIEQNKKSAANAQKLSGEIGGTEKQDEIKAALEKNFPDMKYYPSVSSLRFLGENDTGYFLPYDADYIILKVNVDNKNINNILEIANLVPIKVLIGNLVLTNNATITSFPPGFPKKIEGDMTLMTLPKLINFNNAPNVVTGNVTIRVAPSPGSVMGRKLSKTITPEREQAYASSITKTVNPVNDDERHPKDLITRGNMINKSNESVADIIKNRIMLGESFMKEGRDTEFSDMFPYRTKPQLGYIPDPDSDEYKQHQTHYDNRISKYEKDMSEYEMMKDIADKNWGVYRNILHPILKINIGDIHNLTYVNKEGKKVGLLDKVVSYNNVHAVRIKAVEATSNFKGAMIFMNNNNIISAMYCKMKNNRKPHIVCMRGDDGNIYMNHDFIKSEFKKRWNIMHRLYLLSKETGIDWNNLAKGEQGVDNKYVSLEEVAINLLFPVLCTLHGGANTYVYRENKAATEYKFVRNVLDEEQFYNMDSKSVFDYIMGMIFKDFMPKSYDKFDDKNTSYKLGDATINFTFNQQNRQHFITNAIKNLNENIFDIFNDKFLRILAIGASLRGYDQYSIIDHTNIEDEGGNIIMDHSELSELLYSIKDVNIFDTCLKSMSAKDIDKNKFDIKDPSDMLLYFPDVCSKAVNIKIDIEKAAEEAIYKLAKRDVIKTNVYNTIKDYDYDPETRTRTRNDYIGVADRTKDEDEEEIDDFTMFSANAAEFKQDVDSFNKAKSSLKNAIAEYNDNVDKSWKKDNETLYRFENAFNDISNITSIIEEKIINNKDNVDTKELADKYRDIIVNMNDKFTEIFLMFNNVVNGETVEDKIGSAKNFISLSDVFKGYYNSIAGGNINYVIKALNKTKRLSDRNASRNANQGKTSVRVNPNIDKFAAFVDNMSSKYTQIYNIVNDINYNSLPGNSKLVLKTASDVISVIDVYLNKIISFGNTIINDNNVDIIDNLINEYRNVSETCDGIIEIKNNYGDSSDKHVIKELVRIVGEYEDIADVAERYNMNMQSAAATV